MAGPEVSVGKHLGREVTKLDVEAQTAPQLARDGLEHQAKHLLTVDILVEESANHLKRISVRGTVAESQLMVARINEFDGLYFVPGGPLLCCIYEDRPGVIATVSRHIADLGINIEDMRNPHDSKTGRSLVILKLSQAIDAETVAKVAADIDSESALCITL